MIMRYRAGAWAEPLKKMSSHGFHDFYVVQNEFLTKC